MKLKNWLDMADQLPVLLKNGIPPRKVLDDEFRLLLEEGQYPLTTRLGNSIAHLHKDLTSHTHDPGPECLRSNAFFGGSFLRIERGCEVCSQPGLGHASYGAIGCVFDVDLTLHVPL